MGRQARIRQLPDSSSLIPPSFPFAMWPQGLSSRHPSTWTRTRTRTRTGHQAGLIAPNRVTVVLILYIRSIVLLLFGTKSLQPRKQGCSIVGLPCMASTLDPG